MFQGKVVIIRGEGPKGGPGMPEMLTPTSAIMGAGLGKVWLVLCVCVVIQLFKDFPIFLAKTPEFDFLQINYYDIFL